MKYTININQLAIIENGFNIKGTNLDTWALLDFLVFFNSAKNHKTLNKDGVEYICINYTHIQDKLPLCNLSTKSLRFFLILLFIVLASLPKLLLYSCLLLNLI